MSIDKGVLYIVATPIGNLADMTYRAVEVLSQVDLIAAEDTRHSETLLRHFDIKTPCIALHEYSEKQITGRLIARLHNNEAIALISDAGTPLISDPGYVFVKEAHSQNIRVTPIPGASALMAALSAAGLPTDRFSFEGFLPAKQAARRHALDTLRGDTRTLIFFESPHRIIDTLADMVQIFGAAREAVIARELTKRFETLRGDTLKNLLTWASADPNQQKGEFVVLVHGAPALLEQDIDPISEKILRLLTAELPVKKAAALAAQITGKSKNAFYQFAIGHNLRGMEDKD